MFRKRTYQDLFTINGCLNQEALQQYVAKTVSRGQKKAIEQHLNECEFCKEAVEGLEDKNIELSVTFNILNERINKRFYTPKHSHFKRNRPRVGMGYLPQSFLYATVLFILLFITLFFLKDPGTFGWKSIFDTKEYKHLEHKKTESKPIQKLLKQISVKENGVEWTQLSNGKIVFYKTETMPVFEHPNYTNFDDYIRKNMLYPDTQNMNVSGGVVFLKILINKEGKVETVNIVKGLNPTFDKEAKRLIKNSPNWIPGRHENVPVNVIISYKLRFKRYYPED